MIRKILFSISALAFCGVLLLNILANLKIETVSILDLTTIAVAQNNEGTGNIYYYQHLLGQPKECTLYKGVDINGKIVYSENEGGFGVGWTVIKISGIKETCPKSGGGCTVYSCQTTN